MDEADIIADRKLILTHGVICCLSSNIYLINYFCMKYNLELEMNLPKEVNYLIHRVIPQHNSFYNLIETRKDMINGIYSFHSQSQSNITETNDSSFTTSSTTQSS